MYNIGEVFKLKKIKTTLLISSVISVILEALPYGAVCNFADQEGSMRKTFSYFSLTPFGYANFGPFITAMLTCIILVISVVLLCGKAEKITGFATVTAFISILTSLMPLSFGISYFSVTGGVISALMIINFILITIIKKRR